MRETPEMWVRSFGQEDPLKEEIATQSSILAWRIPRTEEPGGLQSMGSQRQTQLKHIHAKPQLKSDVLLRQNLFFCYLSLGFVIVKADLNVKHSVIGE